MSEDKDGQKKPFYENIVESKKRSSRDSKYDHSEHGPRRERTPRGDAAPQGEKSSRDGARPARGERAPRDGARPARGGYAPRDDRAPRGDARNARGEYAPRGEHASSGGQAPRGGNSRHPFVAPRELAPVFGKLSPETQKLLESFPDIVQAVMPLDSKKILALPTQIRELSHGLTDERSDRRIGYMNDPAIIGSYVRYYMWWNLVRLSHVFSSLALELADGDSAVDLGSGPLTVPIALWMARPDLRKKKISWYCVDISQNALSVGEELFLSLAAKTGDEPWQITRIKGECGVSLKRRVRFVACANMFNELFWDSPLPLEALAKQYANELSSYADTDAYMLVVEPGIPRSGRFVSLLRDSFMRLDFHPLAPCPHEGVCPFPGLRNGKWCHFVLDASGAPAKLRKLSDDAGLSKDRAALSFTFMRRTARKNEEVADDTAAAPESRDSLSMVGGMAKLFPPLRVRVTSDPIKLPDFYLGRYGCSELGMVMLVGTYAASDYLRDCVSGSLVEVPMPDLKKAEIDGKTGAIVIRLR